MGQLALLEYTVWILLALMGGGAIGAREAARTGMEGGRLYGAMLVLTLGGALGARLLGAAELFLLLSPSPPAAILLYLPPGALSGAGALLGGSVALLLWTAVGRPLAWRSADLLAPALPLVGALLWLACARYALAYGLPVQSALALPLPDSYGLVTPRWPVQGLGALSFLLLGGGIFAVGRRHRLPPGGLTLLTLWAMGLLLFLLAFLRGDPALFIGPFRLEQLVALAVILVSGLALPLRWWGRERQRAEGRGALLPVE